MKKILSFIILTGFTLISGFGVAWAHFGMIIPSDSMVMQGDSRTIDLNISFSHPFEMIGMDLDKPKSVTVVENGKAMDVLSMIKDAPIMNHRAWIISYPIKRPGIYIFLLEPRPYWEPAEDCFIIHYTKTVVAAYGVDVGWDEKAGTPTEIVPLSKPYGLYVGNLFQGVVELDGKPVPYAEVEVEYYNQTKKAVAPTDYMITQTIKADSNGVFTYAVPRDGWWGFAALNTANYKLEKDGIQKDVELGAVIWVESHPWIEK